MENIKTVACVEPIAGRHVPYRLNNGEFIIENNIIVLTDQFDDSICACETTENNLKVLGIVPMSISKSVSSNPTTSDSESSNIDSNAKNSGIKKGERWSTDATLFLIDQWKKNSSKFVSTTIRNEEVWKNIVKELEDAGFHKYTWKQAEDKWKNLRKAYMKVKDNQGDKSSGAAKMTCKFYDEFDEIFRKSPSVKPLSITSSRTCRSYPTLQIPITNNESDENSDEHLNHQPIKKKKTKLEKDTLAWMSTFREDAAAREEKREEAREKRHQETVNIQKETINILRKAIDSYEIQMQKLIDKL